MTVDTAALRELVERLRNRAPLRNDDAETAADAIAALLDEVEGMREALESAIQMAEGEARDSLMLGNRAAGSAVFQSANRMLAKLQNLKSRAALGRSTPGK